MEQRAWRVDTEKERSEAIFDLGGHGYRAGRDDRQSGAKMIVVKAEPDAWEHVERVIKGRAPSAVRVGKH